MKYPLLFLLLLFYGLPLKAVAQYENVWAFGVGAGLDFNSGHPVPIKTNIRTTEGSASVCDASGQLLFYTDGTSVWDKNNNIMPNGGNITGIAPSISYTSVTQSTTQAALIVPMPGYSNKYYLFSLTSSTGGSPVGLEGRLYYSIVDMHLNNGLGDIVAGEKGILLDTNLTEKMIGVTGNKCNVWLLTHAEKSKDFKVWEITEEGIAMNPIVSTSGHFEFNTMGALKISSNRRRLVMCNSYERAIELFDFNPATGKISNSILLEHSPLSYAYDAVFSPNNTKLYVSYNLTMDPYIYQFKLNTQDPVTTKTNIGMGRVVGTQLRTGPDGKIYLNGHSKHSLSVINQPNKAGLSCGLVVDAIQLQQGTQTSSGLPNSVPVIIHDTLLTVQDAVNNRCFSPLPLTANDSSGWDYLWNTGRTAPGLTVDTPGTYWVSYHTPPCTFHTDTFHVSFPNGVLPDIIMDTACAHTSNGGAYAATYPGDTVTYHYLWRNSTGDTLSTTDTLAHVPSGNYTLQVKTAHCDTMLSFSIPEMDYRVSFQADTLICQGTTLHFHNTSDPHFSSFRWDFGDGDSSTFSDPEHHYPHAGTYGVRLIGEGRICTDTAHKTITVDSQLSGRFHLQPERICIGETVFFYPDAGDSTIEGLRWQFGDGTEMSSGIEHKLQHAYDSAGRLPVTLTTSFRACPDTAYTDTVEVYPLPYVDLGKDTSICLQGAPVTLTNLAENRQGIYHYLWNTGDTAKEIQVRHPGEYSLKVSTAPLGCYTKETVRVTKDCYIDIPNAFTPNGDGNNDYFLPRKLLSKGVTGFKMDIYNRWGEKVFSTHNPIGRGWDGRFNGVPQPQGVYVYTIDVRYKNNRTEHYQGNVTLIR